MPFCVTELCNRLLEASHDPTEVICQMRAGPLGDVIGRAVKGFGHAYGNACKRIGISAATDGRSHCTFPVRELECCSERGRHRARSRHVKTAAEGQPLANRPRRNVLPEEKDREGDGWAAAIASG